MRPVRNLSVVSLLGGLTRGSVLNVYEIASKPADLFEAECIYVAAPIFTDTEASRDLLIRQSILQDAFAHARRVDLAMVSVGSLDLKATNFRLGLVNDADLVSLRKAGGYSLVASAQGYESATSAAFEVTPGPAASFALVFPASVTAGQEVSLSATAYDAHGNVARSYVGPVNVT